MKFNYLFLLLFVLINPSAWAQNATPKGPSMLELAVPMIGFFFIMYFLMIRPQQKRQKEHQNLLTNLKAGEEVITSGGIIGRVRSVSEGFVSLDIGGNTTIKVLKSNIAALTKQAEKAASPKKAPAKA